MACIFTLNSAHADIRVGDKVTVPFNSKADKAKFVDIRGPQPDNPNIGSAYHSKKGIGASGGIVIVNVGTTNKSNDIATYYAPSGLSNGAGKIILQAGETLSMRIDFKVTDPDSAATPRLGLTSLNGLLASTQDGKQLDIPGGKDTLGGAVANGIAVCLVSAKDKAFNISNSLGGKRVFSSDANGPYQLKQDGWYQYTLKIYKTPTAEKFEVRITLNELNQSGNVSQCIGQHSATIVNTPFYKATTHGALAGFTFINNGKGHSGTKEYDNFYIEIEKGNQVGNLLVNHVEPTRKKSRSTSVTSEKTPTDYATLLGIGGISIVLPK